MKTDLGQPAKPARKGGTKASKPAAAKPTRATRKVALPGPKRGGVARRAEAPAPSDAARALAVDIAAAGLEKKAIGVEVIDVSGRVDYADYLVIMTGRSDRHVHAISTGIEETLKKTKKTAPLSVEGLASATWVLLDFGEVVVHVFQEETRKLYDIEGLWIDAVRVALPEGAEGTASDRNAAAVVVSRRVSTQADAGEGFGEEREPWDDEDSGDDGPASPAPMR